MPLSSWPAQTGSPRAGARGDESLVLGRVDGERPGDGDRRAAGGAQRVERGVDRLGVEPARRVEEHVLGVQRTARREPQLADPRAPAGQPQLRLGADPDDADARTSPSSSAFIACVVE